MEASKLNQILEQHKFWIESAGKHGQRANLEYANLTDANLEGADLDGANLEKANLEKANLTDANLEGADLRGANLYGAKLRGANLKDANLSGANLSGADLRVANLKDTVLSGAVLSGAYLKDATGLPNVSWIIPGCLVHLNNIMDHIFYNGFYLEKEDKWENFAQDSLGFFIQNNGAEKTFDMLVEDRIIRNIPDWVKLSGLNKLDP